jgi:hypothetical protein
MLCCCLHACCCLPAAAVVSANSLLAVNSAQAAHDAAGKLVGGLLTKSLDAHKSAGKLLIEIVNAINSLNIAGINLAAGVTNSALTGVIGKIRWVCGAAMLGCAARVLWHSCISAVQGLCDSVRAYHMEVPVLCAVSCNICAQALLLQHVASKQHPHIYSTAGLRACMPACSADHGEHCHMYGIPHMPHTPQSPSKTAN